MAEPDEILSLIDLVYACAWDPDRWPGTLAAMARTAGAVCSDFYVFENGQLVLASHGGLPESVMAEYLSRYHGRVGRSKILPKIPEGGTLTDLDFISDSQMRREPFYEEFLARWGMRHFLGTAALQSNSLTALVSLQLPIKMGPPEEKMNAFARTVSPHIGRAVQISQKLQRQKVILHYLRDALERLTVGAIMLRRDGNLIDMNAAADRILTGTRALTIWQGRLRAASSALDARLQRLIGAALTPESLLQEPLHPIRVEREAGELPLAVAVAPLPRKTVADSEIGAIVFISDPASRGGAPAEALRGLWGLTPAEAALAEKLATSHNLDEAAASLWITRETARSRLKLICSKAGLRGRADLVRMTSVLLGQVTGP